MSEKLKEIKEYVEKRIRDLESMLEVDEPEMWETSTISESQARTILSELNQFKDRFLIK